MQRLKQWAKQVFQSKPQPVDDAKTPKTLPPIVTIGSWWESNDTCCYISSVDQTTVTLKILHHLSPTDSTQVPIQVPTQVPIQVPTQVPIQVPTQVSTQSMPLETFLGLYQLKTMPTSFQDLERISTWTIEDSQGLMRPYVLLKVKQQLKWFDYFNKEWEPQSLPWPCPQLCIREKQLPAPKPGTIIRHIHLVDKVPGSMRLFLELEEQKQPHLDKEIHYLLVLSAQNDSILVSDIHAKQPPQTHRWRGRWLFEPQFSDFDLIPTLSEPAQDPMPEVSRSRNFHIRMFASFIWARLLDYQQKHPFGNFRFSMPFPGQATRETQEVIHLLNEFTKTQSGYQGFQWHFHNGGIFFQHV